MSKNEIVTTKWLDKMAFEAEANGHKIILDAEPQKPVVRKLWVFNNHNEDFEIESTSSKSNIIRILSQEKVNNGYHLEVEITPPAAESGKKIFTDVFSVTIEGGKELEIKCRGFYAHRPSSSSP